MVLAKPRVGVEKTVVRVSVLLVVEGCGSNNALPFLLVKNCSFLIHSAIIAREPRPTEPNGEPNLH